MVKNVGLEGRGGVEEGRVDGGILGFGFGRGKEKMEGKNNGSNIMVKGEDRKNVGRVQG